MPLRDFYKDQYELESKRRQELSTALGIPLGVLSLVIGGLLIVAKAVGTPLQTAGIFQLVALAATGAFVLATAYFLAKSYFGYGYGYIATAREIQAFCEELSDYYQKTGLSVSDAKARAEVETSEHIDGLHAQYADLNTKNNDRKSSFLFKANGALILSVVSFVIAAGPYVIGSVMSGPEVHKVEVLNLKEAFMSSQKSTPQQPTQQPQPSQQQQPAVAPTKPSPPPGRVIKEHVDPTKKK